MPAAVLPDLEGKHRSLTDLAHDGALLVVFACNHCPYVRLIEAELAVVAREARESGIRTVAICSNDVVTYPDDDVPGLADQAARAGWDFPYLVDESQIVARAFHAVCTPDFFLYDTKGQLYYRGAFDDATPGNGRPVTGESLREAIGALVRGEQAPSPQRPAMGCGIKWKHE